MTCKSSFLTIFFWHLRLPISKHQINTSINQGLRVCLKNNKSINLLCRANTSNLSAGLNNSHYKKNFDTKHCLFFHKCLSLFFRCCLLVPAMMAMKWSSLFFFFLLVSSGCRLFSLQADSSVSFLLGLGCRRFILPHISGRSVSLFPLRLGLQANLTAPYFRQVCQSPSQA